MRGSVRRAWCLTCVACRFWTRRAWRACWPPTGGPQRDRRKLLLVRGGVAVQRLMAITAVGQHFVTVNEVPEELRAPVGVASEG